MADKPRTSKYKGKGQSAVDLKKAQERDSMDSPFLCINDSAGFKMQKSNLLNDPTALIMNEYVNFDLEDLNSIDKDKMNESSNITIVLRYYEYLVIGSFDVSYILPMISSGLSMKDIFELIKHHLKMIMVLNIPTVDTIYDLNMIYTAKIKY